MDYRFQQAVDDETVRRRFPFEDFHDASQAVALSAKTGVFDLESVGVEVGLPRREEIYRREDGGENQQGYDDPLQHVERFHGATYMFFSGTPISRSHAGTSNDGHALPLSN